jgi:DNA-binding transcriptional LysR family regulator
MPKSFDWSHLQTLVAVAEHGSLSGAARALGGSQPTMGRHVSALESALGVGLFERTGGGLELTPTGAALLEHARHMAEAANRLSLLAEGRSETIAGTIRVTASDIVATYILPEILTALHRAEPDIDIELVASDRAENLLQREADIAIRMFRPTQADVFTRKVGALETGMFAAHSYLERRRAPGSIQDIMDHDVIGYDRSDLIIQGFRASGLDVDRHFSRSGATIRWSPGAWSSPAMASASTKSASAKPSPWSNACTWTRSCRACRSGSPPIRC